ncbi:MAG: hypothetical protein ACOVRN_01825 [Flavobacterium sp.]
MAGFITFFTLMLFAYFIHRGSHDFRNVFTILHHYHHEHNNFFSHFSQIVLELLLGATVIPLHYFLGDSYINLWTGVLFTLFYSTVHNINYGQLHVNDVHAMHHREIDTNIGPDICDIAFDTKNPKNTEVENTWHYVPNVIAITLVIVFLKRNESILTMAYDWFLIFLVLCVTLVATSSIYLSIFYKEKDITKELKEKDITKELKETDITKELTEPSILKHP